MSTSEEPTPEARAHSGQSAATPRYAKKKQAIVAAASAILNRDGVKGMTLSSVASRVGLITTSVTYYFKKKEDLAVVCFLDGIRRFDEVISEALLAPEPDPQGKLVALLGLWLNLHKRIALGEEPPIAVFNDIRALQKPQRTVVLEAYMRFFGKVRSIFTAPGLPHVDEKSATARAHVLTEQIFWAAAWLPRYDIEDYDRIRDRMADIFAHGLVLSGNEWRPAPLPLDEVLQSTEELAPSETFLIAATRLINNRGYRGASVEKISARLNVTKGSFYHHNDTKDGLVVECFKRSFEAMRRVQRAVTDTPRDHWSKLMTIAATLVNYQLSDRGPLLRASALTALPGTIRQEMVEASNRVSDRFSSIISDGIAAGSVRAVDPIIASQMLTATLNASAEINYWIPGVSSEEAVELYARPMLMGAFS